MLVYANGDQSPRGRIMAIWEPPEDAIKLGVKYVIWQDEESGKIRALYKSTNGMRPLSLDFDQTGSATGLMVTVLLKYAQRQTAEVKRLKDALDDFEAKDRGWAG